MTFSFGTELWDKPEAILNFNDNNSAIVDRFQKIIGEFCKAQLLITSSQKRLLEKFLLENETLKKSEYNFSSNSYFITEQVLAIINAQETFGEGLLNEVDEIIKTKAVNIKKDSRLLKTEKKKLFDDLAKENQKLDNDLKRYSKRYNDMETARVASEKAEENKALSRNQVDNYQAIFISRKCQYDDAMREYSKTLDHFNNYQTKHYSTLIGEWGEHARQVEEERYDILKSTFTNLSELCKSLSSKFNEIADHIESKIDTIEWEKDCLTLINQEKTGDVPPRDVPFHSFENEDKTEMRMNDARNSKISNSGSDSTSSSNGHKNSMLSDVRRDTRSLSRNVSTTNKDNGHLFNGGSKIFGKLFGVIKKSKELTLPNIQSESENADSLSENKCVNNNNNESKPNEDIEHEIINVKKATETLKENCVEPRKSDTSRRISLFQSMRHKFQNKSFDESNVLIKEKSVLSRINRFSVQHQYEKRRSRSISSITFDQTDYLKKKPSIRSKKPSFKIDKKVTKPKLFPKPMLRRQTSSENQKEQSTESRLQSKSIEVLGIGGPVEIVSTPAEAMASIARSSRVSQSENEEIYVDSEMSPINESEAFDYCYVGSCVAIHEYKNTDTSKLYLSFDSGEQFYIIQESNSSEESGWLLVEKTDRSLSGYVPVSYMEIRRFDTPVHMSSDHPIFIT